MFNKKEFHKLENKSIIKIFGKDKFSFIQGIISNDIEILKKKSSIYSSILSPQGKFIVDFFLSIYKEFILLWEIINLIMSKSTILITGANGVLGNAFKIILFFHCSKIR